MYFSGFPKEGLQFLQDLSVNNNRNWFLEHKKRYEETLKEPAKVFIHTMEERFSHLQLPYDAHPKRSVFRIHRDTRFSKDKTPYKTNIGISFPYQSKDIADIPLDKTEKPGLYLHIDPKGCFIAGGLYMPISAQLLKIREALDTDWEILHEVSKNSMFLDEFPDGLTGEKLKTMPKGFQKDHPGIEYLRMKQFLVFSNIDVESIYTEELLCILEAKAIAMAPVMEFLSICLHA